MNDRSECPYRHENGNCLPVGGFCTAVPDEYCEQTRRDNDCIKRNDAVEEVKDFFSKGGFRSDVAGKWLLNRIEKHIPTADAEPAWTRRQTMANTTLYMNRSFEWDKDVLAVTDKVHDAFRDAAKKIDDATCGVIVNHFECDLSDFREYLRDREEWQRRQAERMPKWIAVTDEPPEAGVIVWDGLNPPHEARMIGEIIIEDDGERQTKVYVDGEELTEYLTGDGDEMPPRITHWTTMPEPPETDAPAKNSAETPT